MAGLTARRAVPRPEVPVVGAHIGGRWEREGELLLDLSPSDPDRVVARFAAGTPDCVRRACAAARDAQPAWAATSPLERGAVLWRAAALLEARAERLAAELTVEEGKPIREARGELARAVGVLRWFAGEAAQPVGEVHPTATPPTLVWSQREPLGVVAAITPWNFPVVIALWKIAPAVAFGNTVVWKPSELTPLCAARVVELLVEAGLPPGVLNLVTGDPAVVGDPLTTDPDVDAVTFTGSVAVGRHVQTQAVARGKKVQLETGGKNPAVVCPDADLDRAVALVVRGAMGSSGQKCTATSRVLLVGDVAGPFTERLLAAVADLAVGDPLDEATVVGPLVSGTQLARVLEHLEVAAAEGHEPALGGGRPDLTGHFVEPTVFLDADPASHLGQEELFGPIVATMPVPDLDAAIAVANDVRFGLSASVHTRDLATALRFVREARAGVVHVNRETPGAEPQVPFGGVKASSSHSREQGKSAAEFFTALKTVYVDP
jgi:alpha-ketoglutaric semialdehyde dehydrogenase